MVPRWARGSHLRRREGKRMRTKRVTLPNTPGSVIGAHADGYDRAAYILNINLDWYSALLCETARTGQIQLDLERFPEEYFIMHDAGKGATT